MGRPLGLESVCEKYLSALEGHRAELTLRQLRRDLKTIQDDIHTLHASGCLTTSDPRALSAENLAAIIAYWRVRPKRGPNNVTEIPAFHTCGPQFQGQRLSILATDFTRIECTARGLEET